MIKEIVKMDIHWHENDIQHMCVKEKNKVVWLDYPLFEDFPDIVHAFSTRLGGVSEGIYSSMNLSFTRGDKDASVYENYKRFASAVGFDVADIVTSDQTHTTNVRVVTSDDRGNGITKPRPYTDVDGMITNEPGLVLATFYADCVPLYFVDPVHRAIGLSHSGWRGTAGRIGEATINKMHDEFGSEVSDLYTAIGPSICQDCYEVSEDVIEEFEKAFSKKYWDKLFYKKNNDKYQLNLWEANRIIMMEAGVNEQHIAMPGICTCCNSDFLFSHRASHGKRGNLGAFLGIRRR